MYYDSESALKNTLLGLANGTINLESYKTKAANLAVNYTPTRLYQRLVH